MMICRQLLQVMLGLGALLTCRDCSDPVSGPVLALIRAHSR